jgi:putative ABC transport system permease protein
MGVLTRKLLRDLWRLRGQVAAVALVVASGVALLVMSLSSLTSLESTTEAYYERYAFADVFASAKRAPEKLAERMREIDGVRAVETRISAFTTVDVADMDEPVVARLVSVPGGRQPRLNRLAIRSGRLPEAGRDDEAVLLAPFAEAHGLGVGDSLEVLLNGAKREVRVTGLALSPEYVYAMGPGALMPDEERFGVVWMDREALAAAYDLEGAFNDVSLALMRGTDARRVIDRLDLMLERHGGRGAIARADQISHWFLMNEFAQLRSMATILPTIFLLAAAFLTNTVLARLIDIERREISLMKAFGYRNLEVGLHYAQMALAMALLGVLVGWAAGVALGRYNTSVYSEFFRFPFLHYSPSGAEFAISAAVSLGSALFGAVFAVRRAVILPPAEAMRPPLPASARGSLLPEALTRRLDHPTRMILRQIARAPVRSALTVVGVALAIGVLVMAMQWTSAIETLTRSHFTHSQHQDVTVGFFEPRPMEARFALARLPGVLSVDPVRISSADFRHGLATHRGAITGLAQGATLAPIEDVRGWVLPVPRAGVVLGTELAEKLGAGVGDTITVEVLEGARTEIEVAVTGLQETYIAMPATMELSALNRAIGEGEVFEYAHLLVDPAQEDALFAALREMPGIAMITVKRAAMRKMTETLGETILIFSSFFVVFSGTLAIGVIYNATRIALSERARELATLRVLGFRRGEISYILLGEAALLTFLALPLGCLAGYGLVMLISESFRNELFRTPLEVEPAAYGTAVVVCLISSAISALIVRRRLDRLDLVGVLKTRE